MAAISAAIDAAKADERPSHHRRADPHRLRQPEQAGHPEGARRAARAPTRSSSTKEAYGWDPDRTFYVPGRGRELFRSRDRRGQGPRRRMGGAARPLRGGVSRRRPRSSGGGCAAGCPTAGTQACPRYEAGDRGRDAQREPGHDPGARGVAARAVRRRRGPVGVEPDRRQGERPDHFEADHAGRNLRFGVREHGMGAIANGIAYHGGFLPYCATFLTFSDYMRGSVRLASLSGPARHLRLDPRLGRPRRGRPDPSAGRALRRAAGDAEPVVRAPRRRQRGGGGLGAGRRTADDPGARLARRARVHPPEAADAAGTPTSTPARASRRGGYVLREASGGKRPSWS